MASSAKLAVNLILLSDIASLTDAFTVDRAGGLGDEELTDLLADSPVVAPRDQEPLPGHSGGIRADLVDDRVGREGRPGHDEALDRPGAG
jgi:hypothetical protein